MTRQTINALLVQLLVALFAILTHQLNIVSNVMRIIISNQVKILNNKNFLDYTTCVATNVNLSYFLNWLVLN